MCRCRRIPLTAGAVLVALLAWGLAAAAQPKPAWVIPNTATVRSGPGTDHDSVGSLARGAKVYVLAEHDKWCEIKLHGGKKAWVAGWLLEFSASKGRKLAAATTTVAAPGVSSKSEAKPAKSPKAAAKSSSSSSASSARSANPPAWVSVSAVNVRKGPGLDHDCYGRLDRGTKVYIVGHKGDWRKCRTPGGLGWIRSDCLEFDVAAGRKLAAAGGSGSSAARSVPSAAKHEVAKASAPAAHASGGTAKGFVDGTGVRLREKPTTKSDCVAVLKKGQTVYVVDHEGQWYRLRVHGGNAGWVSDQLIKVAGEHSASESAKPSAVKLEKRPDFPAPTVPASKLHDEATGKPLEIQAYSAGDSVSLRAAPGLGAAIRRKLTHGTAVTVTGVHGHWCFVRLGDGTTGWIAGWMLNYCSKTQCSITDSTGETYPVRVGWVARPAVDVRSGPGLDYPKDGQAAKGATFIVLERRDEWYRAAFGDGSVGWIEKWRVETRGQRLARYARMATASVAKVNESSVLGSALTAASGLGDEIVALAKHFLGCPYVHGGDSPSGFDCSGFVCYVHKQFGIDVSHDSRALFGEGTPVARDHLERGDVVFFRDTYRPGISHVGIYVGRDRFIHASSAGDGVRISSLDKPFYAARYAGARRMHG